MFVKKSGLIGYLLALTLVFFLFEMSIVFLASDFYLGDFQLIAHRLQIPRAVYPEIFYFVVLQLVLHGLFVICVWSLTRLTANALSLSWPKTQTLGFYLWGVGILIFLLVNQWLYPNSKFALFTELFFSPLLCQILLSALLVLMAVVFLLSFHGVLKLFPKTVMSMLATIVCACLFFHSKEKIIPIVTHDAATVEKPNIILIGIDALRPDYLSFFGNAEKTQHIDDFLKNATVFADALTPIARTFPAWTSILTGEYPKQSGIRFDLADTAETNLHDVLPKLLRAEGYQTIFATDETRFSNIDQAFGFDQVISPPVGVNDFLLGSFNDFVFSNVWVNTIVGKWLLPYSYGNRPAVATYNPDMFLQLLKPLLSKPRNKPLFLAVHFCLPHFPYIWGTAAEKHSTRENYHAAVLRADQQLGDFIAMLTRYRLLEHSVVVLLSDHGEALELSGDRATDADLFVPGLHNPKKIIPRFYAKSVDSESVNQSAGHGNDILGLTQYHIVFAFRAYGIKPNQIKQVPDVVSLLDVKPTIIQLLHMPTLKGDGHTLNHQIWQNVTLRQTEQDFYTETDFSPVAVHTVHPEMRAVLFQGIDYYRIDPITTRIYVKKQMGQVIISSKQYADFYGHWVLALYPQDSKIMMPILINLQTGHWTNDLRIPFAEQSPAKRMLMHMRKFFGKDIFIVENVG
ncbi:hypothetical protein AYO45_06200 [Gammaproteobacteria bacterium SCGC AG-212-F23]|nr:hypothetical protein AYO45_06200 [Gammaproteobacteria bacterium SCGC AG-212-F23]